MSVFKKIKRKLSKPINKVLPKPFQKRFDPLNVLGSDYESNAGARKAEKDAQIAASLSEGRQRGLDLAKLGYGQGLEETGKDIQGIKRRLQERSAQSDPISEAIRSQKSGALASGQRNLAASGVKGGAAAGALEEIGRKQDANIAASLYGQQRQSLTDERSLASNMLSGTTSLMFGSEGAANAARMQIGRAHV
jgi:hypothetical protein